MTTRHVRNISEDTEFDVTYSEWMRITGILVQAGFQPVVDVMNKVGTALWQVHVAVQVAVNAFLNQLGPWLVVWLEKIQHIMNRGMTRMVPLAKSAMGELQQLGANALTVLKTGGLLIFAGIIQGGSYLTQQVIPVVKAWIAQTMNELRTLLHLFQEYVEQIRERIKRRKRVNMLEQLLPYVDSARNGIVQAGIVAKETWQATVTPVWEDVIVPKVDETREAIKVKALEAWEHFQEEMKKENPHIKAAIIWLRPRYNEFVRRMTQPPKSHASRAVVFVAVGYFVYGLAAIFVPDIAFVMGFGTDAETVTNRGRSRSVVGIDPVRMVMRQSGVMAVLVGALCVEASKPRHKKLIEVATSINIVLGLSIVLFFAVGWMPAASLLVALVQLVGAAWLALSLYQDDMIKKELRTKAVRRSQAYSTRRRKSSAVSHEE